ncbi:hypothetical protein JEU11_13350 [Paraglaciecola chathamensis]|jgi:hypothetical protein|uniref:Uncharacterized protein n=1 Tax=Paraglaciecola chathamensis TaxID=368405 RepID=A0ABS0WG38_9ALTE|nr:hypothetical protein [Paraglaciecola chathamensis]MBJ2137441.1 hypothetical protein [Paraglaciecola chathamensis]
MDSKSVRKIEIHEGTNDTSLNQKVNRYWPKAQVRESVLSDSLIIETIESTPFFLAPPKLSPSTPLRQYLRALLKSLKKRFF